MISKQFVRKVLVAGITVGSSAVPVSTKCDQICRASELPIYMSDDDCNKKVNDEKLCPPRIGLIECAFSEIRRQVWTAMDKCALYRKEAEDYCNRGSDYASSMFTYLSEDANDTTKMGAIGMGAVTGTVLGLRGGIFRKLLYAGVGAYGMSSVCYPQQTADYTHNAIDGTRKIATIAYNFICGVKKDDIPLPQLPKLPSSMGEVWDMAGSLGKSASSLISGSNENIEKVAADAKSVSVEVRASDEVIQQSHASAHQSCHCPVGACLGRHDSEQIPQA